MRLLTPTVSAQSSSVVMEFSTNAAQHASLPFCSHSQQNNTPDNRINRINRINRNLPITITLLVAASEWGETNLTPTNAEIKEHNASLIKHSSQRTKMRIGISHAGAACTLVLTSLSHNRLVSAQDNTNEAINKQIMEFLLDPYTEGIMDAFVLISKLPLLTGGVSLYQSREYRWKDFVSAYDITASQGFDGDKFIIGDSMETAVVNIALFLGQSRHESISTDSCDENNYSGAPLSYPLSAACGQIQQDYQGPAYRCDGNGREHMECPVDPNMVSKARTKALWLGAPPPLMCAPTSMTGPGTPRWNTIGDFCGPAGQDDVPEFPQPYINESVKENIDQPVCNAYFGQTQGWFTYDSCDEEVGCFNAPNNTSVRYSNVEGCCWWGRGVVQTTGPCNIGQLNYYLTGTRYDNGQASKDSAVNAAFPDLNLCEQPGNICDGPPEIKWLSGLFFWVRSMQNFVGNFNLEQELKTTAAQIFEDPTSEVSEALNLKVSGILNRGCPAATCSGVPVSGTEERFDYFVESMAFFKHALDPLTNPIPDGKEPAPILREWFDPSVVCKACNGGDFGNCAAAVSSIEEPFCLNVIDQAQCQEFGGPVAYICDDVTDFPSASPLKIITNEPSSSPTSVPTQSPSGTPSDVPSSNPTTAAPTNSAAPTFNGTFSPTSQPTPLESSTPTLLPTPERTSEPSYSVDNSVVFEQCRGCYRNTTGWCIQISSRICEDYVDAEARQCSDKFYPCVRGTASPSDPISERPSEAPSLPTSMPTFTLPENCTLCEDNTIGPCQSPNGKCEQYDDVVDRLCPLNTIDCSPITRYPSASPSGIPSFQPSKIPSHGPTTSGTEMPSAIPSSLPTSRPTTARRSSAMSGQQLSIASLVTSLLAGLAVLM